MNANKYKHIYANKYKDKLYRPCFQVKERMEMGFQRN